MAERVEAPALRADARRNRARILEVAREVFASEGLAVPIDTVARAPASAWAPSIATSRRRRRCSPRSSPIACRRWLTRPAPALDADDPGEAFYAFLRMMAERSATDMALADAFAEAGVDIKSSLGVCKQDLTAAVGDLLQRAQDAGAVRTDVSVTDVFALLMSTCLACGRQGREDASERLVGVCSTASVRASGSCLTPGDSQAPPAAGRGTTGS